jgi:hypothetical protein
MITALTELDSLEGMDVKITQQRVDLPNFRRCFKQNEFILKTFYNKSKDVLCDSFSYFKKSSCYTSKSEEFTVKICYM